MCLAFFPRIIECDKHQGFPDIITLQMYFDKYFANDKIISLGPKESIDLNKFLALFSSSYRSSKTSGDNF